MGAWGCGFILSRLCPSRAVAPSLDACVSTADGVQGTRVNGTCVSHGSRIAGRFFTEEPSGKPPDVTNG